MRKIMTTIATLLVGMLLVLPNAAFAEEQSDREMGDSEKAVTLIEESSGMILMSIDEPVTVWKSKFSSGQEKGIVAHGVDVSHHRGIIDWKAAKQDGVERAVIRCGYGDDEADQDDSQWLNNVRGALENDIKVSVYIYSYAMNTDAASSEAMHVIRQLNSAASGAGLSANNLQGIFYDFENTKEGTYNQSVLSAEQKKDICDTFARRIASDSTWGNVRIGLYSFQKWMESSEHLLNVKTYQCGNETRNYIRWIAEWGTNTSDTIHQLHDQNGNNVTALEKHYGIWQVSSTGTVNGITVNGTDLDYWFSSSIEGAYIPDIPVQYSTDGSVPKPSLSVSANDNVLIEGIDYALSYSYDDWRDTGVVTIKGIGNWSGTTTREYSVVTLCNDILGVGNGKLCILRCGDSTLDVRNGSYERGAVVQPWGDNATMAQRWRIIFHPISGSQGYYTLQNIGSSKMLDVAGVARYAGTQVWQWDANESAAQKWTVSDRGNGTYALICGNAALDWTGKLGNGSNWCFEWIENIASGTHSIVSTLNWGYDIDISCASGLRGANVQLWNANGTWAQKFTFNYDYNTGYYEIVSCCSGKALDVANGSCSSGANIWQWDRNGTNAQKWYITKSNGWYIIRSATGAGALDLSCAAIYNGSNIQVWSPNGTGAQLWGIS